MCIHFPPPFHRIWLFHRTNDVELCKVFCFSYFLFAYVFKKKVVNIELRTKNLRYLTNDTSSSSRNCWCNKQQRVCVVYSLLLFTCTYDASSWDWWHNKRNLKHLLFLVFFSPLCPYNSRKVYFCGFSFEVYFIQLQQCDGIQFERM